MTVRLPPRDLDAARELCYILNFSGGLSIADQADKARAEADSSDELDIESADPAVIAELMNQVMEYDPEAELPSCDLTTSELKACQPHLKELADSWLEDGGDLRRWRNRQKLEQIFSRGRVRIVQTPHGGPPRLTLVTRPSLGGQAHAVDKFWQFLASPANQALGKCVRCEAYFIAATGHDRKFCSAACGAKTSATEAVKRKRAETHERILVLCRQAIRKAKGAEWKSQVVEEVNGQIKRRRLPLAAITTGWMTRATNRGELAAPRRNQTKAGKSRD